MKKSLSKLKNVDLRKEWVHENEFTNWLASEEYLDLLSEEIGVNIELIQTEANVGKFNVDILAKEENSERKIIIENQLEDTNHDHLGKIITYASGYNAEIIIWIVKNEREEHKKAIEWLNEHTDENIGFFLIKIELWQIGDSNPAPKFEIIISPNEWAKTIKASPRDGELTDTKLKQLEFWTKLKGFIRSTDTKIRLQSPRPQHWYNFSMGNSDAHIGLSINSRENILGCEIYINRNKELFNYLRDKKDEIEKEIEEKAEWVDASIASRIKVEKKVPFIFEQENYEEYFKWLYEKTILFQKLFGKYIRDFKK